MEADRLSVVLAEHREWVTSGREKGTRADLAVTATEALTLWPDTAWQVRRRTDAAVNALADRHYSRRRRGAGKVAGPGRAIVLMTPDQLATWVTTWPEFNADGLDAWRCSIFRNEGPQLSSDLIRSAMALTAALWPGARPADGWATWVNRSKVASTNPGYCFLKAGWWRDRTYAPGIRQRHLIRLRAAVDGGLDTSESMSKVGKKAAGRVLDGRTHDGFPPEAGDRTGTPEEVA